MRFLPPDDYVRLKGAVCRNWGFSDIQPPDFRMSPSVTNPLHH